MKLIPTVMMCPCLSCPVQCYASMYYSVHETGHRLGFKHANMYQLNEARAAPANPLGPGQFVAASYTDRLDVMSCCKSDYGEGLTHTGTEPPHYACLSSVKFSATVD